MIKSSELVGVELGSVISNLIKNGYYEMSSSIPFGHLFSFIVYEGNVRLLCCRWVYGPNYLARLDINKPNKQKDKKVIYNFFL